MSDAAYGLRSLQVSGAAAAACAFCGYLAAKQLDKPFVADEIRQRGAMIYMGIAVLVVLGAVLMLYRGSPRTKLLAMLALLIAFGGSYGGWTLGWKKGGDPIAIRAL